MGRVIRGVALGAALLAGYALTACGGGGGDVLRPPGDGGLVVGTLIGVIRADNGLGGTTVLSHATVRCGGRETRSGEDGTYRLENIPPGRQTLEVAHEMYATYSGEVDIPRGTLTRDVRLELPAVR